MCAVNDKKRAEIRANITALKEEYKAEEATQKQLLTSIKENGEMKSFAECAKSNLAEVDFGEGATTVSDAITKMNTEIDNRTEWCNTNLKEVNTTMNRLEEAIQQAESLLASIPQNCGACSECNPPKPKTVGTVYD